jgi:hypothetical protein
MSTSLHSRANRSVVRGATALAGALAAVTLCALPAHAAGSITVPSPSGTLVAGTPTTVEGTVDASATYYAVAVCDAANIGTKCDHTAGSYTNLTPRSVWVANAPDLGTITPNKTFPNWNFATNSAGSGSTDCSAVQCAVVLSEYTFVGGVPTPIGAPVTVNVSIV